eukprot:Em0002g679a
MFLATSYELVPVAEDQWPPVQFKEYIKLATVVKVEDFMKEDECTKAMINGNLEFIKRTKDTIEMEKIGRFEDGTLASCIIVEGIPGVGKSTLAWQLGRRWGKKEILQHFQLVIVLCLRDERVQKAHTISELFCHPDPDIQQSSYLKSTKEKPPQTLTEVYTALTNTLLQRHEQKTKEKTPAGMTHTVDSLKNHYSDLVGTIQDPAGLASSLYSRGLISQTVRDEIQQRDLITKRKNEILINAVEAQVTTDPSMFQVFMEVLKEEPSLSTIVERMCVLELSCNDAFCSPLFKYIEEMLLRLYYLYEKSPKKSTDLANIVENLQHVFDFPKGGNLPTRCHGTRWISHKRKALQRVVDRYGAYIVHLHALIDDKSIKATDRAKLKGYLVKWKAAKTLIGCAMYTDALKPVSLLA